MEIFCLEDARGDLFVRANRHRNHESSNAEGGNENVKEKIVIINGSPTPGGNTRCLCEAVLKG